MTKRTPAFSSCARCRGALRLDAIRRDEIWYCSPACADGQPDPTPRTPSVPEPWLYNRPRRFFCKRAPKELRRATP